MSTAGHGKGSHKKLDDELALVDHMSYYNEVRRAAPQRPAQGEFEILWHDDQK